MVREELEEVEAPWEEAIGVDGREYVGAGDDGHPSSKEWVRHRYSRGLWSDRETSRNVGLVHAAISLLEL